MTTTEPTTRNGVDVPTLFATINAVKAQPEAAQFRFRVQNRWNSGVHSVGQIGGFYGVGAEHEREQTFLVDADHPPIVVGHDNGPTPGELLLAALAACLTGGIANIASRAVSIWRKSNQPSKAQSISKACSACRRTSATDSRPST